MRILVRVLHRVLERLLVDHVQVHVEAARSKYMSKALTAPSIELLSGQMRLLRRDRDRVADAVLRVLVGQLRDRQAESEPAMAVAPVHRVGARPERLALAPPVGRVSGRLAVHHVRRDGQHALGVDRVAIGRMLADLLHEARDEVGGDRVDPVVVVAELRAGLSFTLDAIVDGEPGLVADHPDLAVLDGR